MDCEKCIQNKEFYLEPNYDKCDILILLDSPGLATVRGNDDSNSVKLIRSILAYFPTEQRIGIEYVCRCSTKHDRTATYNDMVACRTNVNEIIDKKSPSIIIPMGLPVLQLFRPEVRDIDKLRGMVLDYGTYKLIPTYSPGYIFSYTDAFMTMYRDIEKAILNPYTSKVEPTYVLDDIDFLSTVNSRLYYDIETTGFDKRGDIIRCIGVSDNPDVIYIYSNSFIYANTALLSPFFSRNDFIGHNIVAFDNPFIKIQLGIDVNLKSDTMLKHYMYDERKGSHKLEVVARELCSHESYKDMITDYATQDLETLYKYLAIDVSLLYYIENKMDDKLTDKQKVLYEEQVLPIAKILSDMVEYGTKIDKPYLEKLSVKMHSQSDRMKRALVSRVGKANFNPNSWQQVAEYVYDVLHIPNFKKRTTEAKYFNALIEDGMVNRKQASFLKLLVAYKQKTKLYSTYCVGILRKLDEDIIRTSYLVHGTVTGRLSSVSPNLQNIPARIGGLLKRAFIQRDGMILVEADYKQLEIRVLAWYSNDTRLLDILNSGRDVHTETASYIFKKSIEDVTEYERFIAKSVNFGIPYGIGADKLSKTIKRAVEEADEYIQSYYSIYDGVNGWILGIQDFVLANGYVELPTGRRRNFPLITRSNKGDILREAVNTMVQGMASEIVYNGMINVDRNMPTFNKLLTVHDSLLGECYEAEVHDCVTGLNNNLSDVSKLIKDPPIVFGVDCKVGYTWGDMNKWK